MFYFKKCNSMKLQTVLVFNKKFEFYIHNPYLKNTFTEIIANKNKLLKTYKFILSISLCLKRYLHVKYH